MAGDWPRESLHSCFHSLPEDMCGQSNVRDHEPSPFQKSLQGLLFRRVCFGSDYGADLSSKVPCTLAVELTLLTQANYKYYTDECIF